MNTLHGKLLWSLLAFHPMLFVGFSLEDEYFQKMLKVVRTDFCAGTSKPFHFGIFPYGTKENREGIERHVRSHGVAPIFYEVKSGDHSELGRLIDDFANKLGLKRVINPEDAFNEDMLKL